MYMFVIALLVAGLVWFLKQVKGNSFTPDTTSDQWEERADELAHRGIQIAMENASVSVGNGSQREWIPIFILKVQHPWDLGMPEDACIRKTESRVTSRQGEILRETLHTPRPTSGGMGAALKNADVYRSRELVNRIAADRGLEFLIEGTCQSHCDVHIGPNDVEISGASMGLESTLLSVDSVVQLLEKLRVVPALKQEREAPQEEASDEVLF